MRTQITPRCFRTQSRCGKSRAHRRAARPPCSGPRHPFSSAAPAGWPSSHLPRSPADEPSKFGAVMQGLFAACSVPSNLLQPCPGTPPPSALATNLPYPASTLAEDLTGAHRPGSGLDQKATSTREQTQMRVWLAAPTSTAAASWIVAQGALAQGAHWVKSPARLSKGGSKEKDAPHWQRSRPCLAETSRRHHTRHAGAPFRAPSRSLSAAVL